MKKLCEDKLLSIDQYAMWLLVIQLLKLRRTPKQCDLFKMFFFCGIYSKNMTLRWETMHCSCKECIENTRAVVWPELDIYNLADKCSYSLVLVSLNLVFGLHM